MTTTATGSHLARPVGEGDHIQGPASAPVTLVEYGDFECPFCGRAYPVVKELRRRLGDRLRLVYRHFPRPEHPHARHAAQMAEAAAAQGEEHFWQMHNRLFEHQQALDDAHLVQYAADLGLDLSRAERELAEQVHDPRIQADIESGIRSGVRGTPTFFVNGVKHEGPATLDDLLAAVTSALDEGAAAGNVGARIGLDVVDEASRESFPASDPPGWTPERL